MFAYIVLSVKIAHISKVFNFGTARPAKVHIDQAKRTVVNELVGCKGTPFDQKVLDVVGHCPLSYII